MRQIVISDTSCLITLTRIGELDLLMQLYHHVWVTPEVAKEYGGGLPAWIVIKETKDKVKQKYFEAILDIGEASTIALALELTDCTVIIDDQKGRRIVREHNIPIIGLLGILIDAKKQAIIPNIKPKLVQLRKHGFRFSAKLEQTILDLAGENEN